MALTAEKKAEIVTEYGRGDNDTGSPEVQAARFFMFRVYGK